MSLQNLRVYATAIAASLLAPLAAVALALAPAAAAAQDSSPPDLVFFGLAPNTVDTSTADAVVNVSLRITDDLAGVGIVRVVLQSPSTAESAVAFAHLLSGNSLAGDWTAAVVLPAGGELGLWTVGEVDLSDRVGNTRTLVTADLAARGFRHRVRVDPVPDFDPPELVEFSFTPAVVDTSTAAASVRFRLRASDNLSGVDVVHVSLLSPSTAESADGRATLVSGHPLAGVWEADVLLPVGSELGDWTVIDVELVDVDGNSLALSTADIDAAGFATVLTVAVLPPQDLVPPEVLSFNFGPGTVDVGLGDAPVRVVLTATDDASGVAEVSVTFTSPTGVDVVTTLIPLRAGDPLNGTYAGTVFIPQGSEPGAWTVSEIRATDVAGNDTVLDMVDLAAAGWPDTLTVINNPNATSDTTPPFLDAVRILPSAVDVTTGARTVRVEVDLIDDLSGFPPLGMSASLTSPSFGQRLFQPFDYNETGASLTATFGVNFVIPEFSESGDWALFLGLRDRAGNTQILQASDLAPLGYPHVLRVTSAPDLVPPRLTGLAIAPASVNVSAASGAVVLRMNLVDDASGVNLCEAPCFSAGAGALISPSGNQRAFLDMQAVTRVSCARLDGDRCKEGVWEVPAILPRYAEAGLWRIDFLNLLDFANNQLFLDRPALTAAGLPSTFSVVSTPSDTQPPQLVGHTFGPAFVNSAAGPNVMTLTMTVSDNLSGTGVDPRFAGFGGGFPRFDVTFLSPSGGQALRDPIAVTRIAGNALLGTWRLVYTLPQFAEAGTWTMLSAQLDDLAGNRRFLSTAQLALLGPTTFEVGLPSLASDGAVSPATGGTVTDTVFGPRAQLVVPPPPPALLGADTDVAIDVFSTDLRLPIPAGFSTGGTRYVNIHLTPTPAYPLPAPGLTLVLPLPTQMAPGTVLTLFRVDPATGSLTRAVSVAGGDVLGTVNTDGLSATFAGVARLSTVVGLEPTGAVAGDVDGDDQVNCADVAIVRVAFGKRLGQPGYDARADINRDRVVSTYDLAFVSRRLPAGTTCRITPTGALPR